MAMTVSGTMSTVMGNQRVIGATLTLDAATGDWVTGLNRIVGVTLSTGSAVSGGVKVIINSGSAGTAIGGTLAIASGSTGDQLFAVVYGA